MSIKIKMSDLVDSIKQGHLKRTTPKSSPDSVLISEHLGVDKKIINSIFRQYPKINEFYTSYRNLVKKQEAEAKRAPKFELVEDVELPEVKLDDSIKPKVKRVDLPKSVKSKKKPSDPKKSKDREIPEELIMSPKAKPVEPKPDPKPVEPKLEEPEAEEFEAEEPEADNTIDLDGFDDDDLASLLEPGPTEKKSSPKKDAPKFDPDSDDLDDPEFNDPQLDDLKIPGEGLDLPDESGKEEEYGDFDAIRDLLL
jgi:hypothetical protein